MRLCELCQRLALRLCRPQYECVCVALRRGLCCCAPSQAKEFTAGDFEHPDGTLVELSSSSGGTSSDSDDAEEDEDKEALRYREARART